MGFYRALAELFSKGQGWARGQWRGGRGLKFSGGTPWHRPRSVFIKITCELSDCTTSVSGSSVGSSLCRKIPGGGRRTEVGNGSVGDSGEGICTLQTLNLREGSSQQGKLRPLPLARGSQRVR